MNFRDPIQGPEYHGKCRLGSVRNHLASIQNHPSSALTAFQTFWTHSFFKTVWLMSWNCKVELWLGVVVGFISILSYNCLLNTLSLMFPAHLVMKSYDWKQQKSRLFNFQPWIFFCWCTKTIFEGNPQSLSPRLRPKKFQTGYTTPKTLSPAAFYDCFWNTRPY